MAARKREYNINKPNKESIRQIKIKLREYQHRESW